MQITAFTNPIVAVGPTQPDSPLHGSALKFQFLPKVWVICRRASTNHIHKMLLVNPPAQTKESWCPRGANGGFVQQEDYAIERKILSISISIQPSFSLFRMANFSWVTFSSQKRRKNKIIFYEYRVKIYDSSL